MHNTAVKRNNIVGAFSNLIPNCPIRYTLTRLTPSDTSKLQIFTINAMHNKQMNNKTIYQVDSFTNSPANPLD